MISDISSSPKLLQDAQDDVNSWRSDVRRRIAITVAALAVYRLAMMIPVPGINLAAITRGYPLTDWTGSLSAAQFVSMVAIGLTPAFALYALFECAKLAFEDLRDWGTETQQRAAHRDRIITVIVLALAAFQAYGLAIALGGMATPATAPEMVIVTQPGLSFNALFVASNVAGTALLLWLASIVTRHGIGSGFWVMYLFPSLATLVSMPASMMEQIQSGEISAASPLVLLATLALMSAAAITLTRRWMAATASPAPADQKRDAIVSDLHAKALGVMVWPGFLATALSGYITWALTALLNPDGDPTGLTFGSPQMLAIPAILMVFFTFLFARTYAAKTAATRQNVRGLAIATSLSAAISYIVLEVLASRFGVRLPVSSVAWIAILAVLTPLLPLDISILLPSTNSEPPVTDADFEQR